jgi:hypothetical protein
MAGDVPRYAGGSRGPPLTLPAKGGATLEDLLPPAARRALAAKLEELKRQAAAGRRIPEEVPFKAIIDQKTGTVLDVEIPVRYGWS